MADEYEKYFSAHGLKINITKSEYIVIGSLRTMKVVVDGREEAKSVKLLGLTFDNNYLFSQHVDTVVRKMTARNSQLRKIANIADENTTRMVAMANVLSVANYCSEIFATNPKDVNRIQMKVNETMRIITHSGNRARIKTMMNRLKWLSYHETVMYNKLVMINRILDTSAAPYTTMLNAQGMKNQHGFHNTRVRELKIAWKPRLVRKGEVSFIYSSVNLYNQTKIMGKMVEKDKIKDEFKTIIKSWRK